MFNQQTANTTNHFAENSEHSQSHIQNDKLTQNQKNINNLSQTPVSKGHNAFKSPAPSNKKYLNINYHKSPTNNT